MRWLQALVLQDHPNALVRRLLENDDLPAPTDDELDSLRVSLARPKNFDPRSRSHKPSLALVRELELEPIFRDVSEWREAVAVLRHPRERELVEAGLIIGVPTTALAATVCSQLHGNVSAGGILLYSRMLFDTSCVVRAQLKVLVQARVRLAVERAVTSEQDEVSARRAVLADARTVAVSLPASPLAWSAVLLSLGISPSRVELSQVVDRMAELAAVRAGSSMLRGEDGDERRAETYANIVEKMRQVRESISTPDDDLQKKLAHFTIVTDTKPIVTAAQLLAQGDGVTVDMMPLTPLEVDLSDETGGRGDE
jgi:hypothetical protein